VGDWPVSMHDPRQLGLAEAGLDPRTLSPWSVPLEGRAAAAPVIRAGIAYVGTDAGSLIAVDTTTHTQRWGRVLPAPLRTPPAVAVGALIVSARGLLGLRPSDGSILWQRPDLIATEGAAPMLVGDTVYLSVHAPAGNGAILYAVKAASGADVWSTPLPAGFQGRAAVAAYPEIGLLFVSLGPPPEAARASASPAGAIALRLADGGGAWAAPALFPATPPPAGLAVGWVASTVALPVPQPTVFLAAGSRVTALNATTGAPFWSRDLPEPALPGPPLLSTAAPQGSTLYVGGASGRVYALSSTTGADAPGSMTAPGQQITGTMALAGDYLYLPTGTGLVAAAAKTGAVLWTHPGAVTGGVAVAGGCPFVGTADGTLLGFFR
jgi:outer membrane protein assembly factor BamB